MRAGEIAEAAGVNRETLRYYERRGLLAPPDRSPGGHRLYTEDVVPVLRVIKAAQRLGFTLDEVAELLEVGRHRHGRGSDAGLHAQARLKLVEVEERIADLFTIRDNLQSALDAGCDDLVTCATAECCPCLSLRSPPGGTDEAAGSTPGGSGRRHRSGHGRRHPDAPPAAQGNTDPAGVRSMRTQDFSSEPAPRLPEVDILPSSAASTTGLAASMALAGVLALTGSFLIYGAGRALGVGFRVVSFIGMHEEVVGPQGIVTMTVVGWALGTGLLLGLRHRPWAWPALAVAGAVLALVTVPFFNEADGSTKLALGLMHLTTGGLWVLSLRRFPRLGDGPRRARA